MSGTTQSSGITSNNRIRVAAAVETVWGDPTDDGSGAGTPAPDTQIVAFRELRVTGSSFSSNQTTSESNEVRSDRMNAGTVLQGADASGSIDAEITVGSYDLEMQSAMWWDTADIVDTDLTNTEMILSATINGAGTPSTGLLTDTVGGFPFVNIVVGQWLRMSGYLTNPLNTGYFQVVSVDAAGVFCTINDPDGILNDEDSSATSGGGNASTIVFKAKTFRNGVTGCAFTIQETYLDHDPITYVNSEGMYVNQWTVNIANGSDVTQTFSYQGQNSDSNDLTDGGYDGFGSPTYAAVNTKSIMDSVTSIKDVRINGVTGDEFLLSLALTVNNNVRSQTAVGEGAEAVGVVSGKLSVTADVELYFLNDDEMQAFNTRIVRSLSFRMEDTDGSAIIVTIPKATYSAFQPTGAANDTDTTATSTLTAEVFDNGASDTSSEHMIQIDIIDVTV